MALTRAGLAAGLLTLFLGGCGSGQQVTGTVHVPPGPPAAARFPVARVQAPAPAAGESVSLRSGWNAVAFRSPRLTALGGGSVAGLAWFDGQAYQTGAFTAEEANRNGGTRRGFWVFANGSTSFSYTGDDGAGSPLNLRTGWNLVSVGQEAAVSGANLTATVGGASVPLGSVVLPVVSRIEADGSYTTVDLSAGGALESGRPHWIYSSQDVALSWVSPPRTPSPGTSPHASPVGSPQASPEPSPTNSGGGGGAALPATPRVPTGLRFLNVPATLTAGTSFDLEVELTDQYGTRLAIGGDVQLQAQPGHPLAGQTVRPLSSGVAHFTGLTLSRSGQPSLTATYDSVNGVQPLTVLPGTATQLVFRAQPTHGTAGTPLNPPVQAVFQDANGNDVIPTPPVTVTLASSANDATLHNKSQATDPTTGVATFPDLRQNLAGTGYTLTASGTADGNALTAASDSFDVVAATAMSIAYQTGPATTLTAGTAESVTVELRDQFGNVDPTATNTITLAIVTAPSLPNAADLDTDTAVTQVSVQQAASGGRTTFSIKVNNVGGWSLQASTPGVGTNLGWAFSAGHAAPNSLVFVQQPTNGTAGVAINPTVQAVLQDVFGNEVVPNPAVTVSLVANQNDGTLTNKTADTDSVTGRASFASLRQDVAAAGYSLTASATVGGSQFVSSASASFTVSPASATTLVFNPAPPTSATAGTAVTATVELRDAFGNLDTSATNTVTLAPGTVPGDGDLVMTTPGIQSSLTVAAVGGQASFVISPTRAGSWTLQASAGGVAVNPSWSFAVGAGSLTQLRLLSGDTQVIQSLQGLNMMLEFIDSWSNRVDTSQAVAVTLTTNPTGATLLGTTTRAAVAGLVTFDDLSLRAAGAGYGLAFTSGSFSATATIYVSPQRISVATGNVQANAGSSWSKSSGDGRYVVFTSDATNLVANDSNGVTDVFYHDRVDGTTFRVSVTSAGVEANGRSYHPAISRDGRYVAFTSDASNLVGGDTNGVADVFWFDRQTGERRRISVSSAGAQGDGLSERPDISDDGREVVFQSVANNLVTGDVFFSYDVYLHDTQTGATTKINLGPGGTHVGGGNGWPRLSANGRYITYHSNASGLVAGDSNNEWDIFLSDITQGTTERISVNSSGGDGNGSCNGPVVSDDGRYVAFESSSSNLVAGDTNGYYDLFVRDRQTGTTSRVGSSNYGPSYGASISGDGRYVGFQTAFLYFTGSFFYSVRAGQVADLLTSSIAGSYGYGSTNVANFTLSPDGRFVLLDSSGTVSVSQDTNNAGDIYILNR